MSVTRLLFRFRLLTPLLVLVSFTAAVSLAGDLDLAGGSGEINPPRQAGRPDLESSLPLTRTSRSASASATAMTSTELGLLRDLAGTEDEARSMVLQLKGEGRRGLREYLEVQVLRQRLSQGDEVNENPVLLGQILEHHGQYHRDRLTNSNVSLAEIESRISSLESLTGEGARFSRRREELLNRYRQIRIRLGTNHGDERQ